MPVDIRTARERLNAAHAYLHYVLIGPIREGQTTIPAHIERELEHGLGASLSNAQDLLGDADPTRSAVGGEIELIEIRNASPSVRLARWLDADPERSCELLMGNDEEWWCHVYAPHRHEVTGLGPTRDEAITAALAKAAAGATTEGEQHAG